MTHLARIKVAVISTIFSIAIGIITVGTLPLYAQDISDTVPDLSGHNIYFSVAHSEPSRFDRGGEGISRFAGLLELTGANLHTLEWRDGIPADADLIVIVGPGSSMPTENVIRLWNYIGDGGNLLLVTDPFDSRRRFGRPAARGFFGISWNDWGVRARTDMAVHPGEERQTVDVEDLDRDGNVTFSFSGEVPILETNFLTSAGQVNHPIMNTFTSSIDIDDDIPANLTSLYFDSAHSFEVDAAPQLGQVTPLLFASEEGMYGEVSYARYLADGYSDYNLEDDTPLENLILAAAYEGHSGEGRAVVLGDRDFVQNDGGYVTFPSYGSSFVYPINVQFMMNSVVWLLDGQPVALSLPTPIATATATMTPTPTLVPSPTPTPTDG